jgi:signal transduction histidine kinase
MRQAAAPARNLDRQLESLQELCHAFASATDLSEVTSSTLRWIHETVGRGASLRISLEDRGGRLRTVAESGTGARNGRKRSTRRRQVFEAKSPLLLDRDPGMALAVLPLVCRGAAVGTLEVVAPNRLIEEGAKTLEAVASQLAVAVCNLRDRHRYEREVKSLGSAAHLVRELVRAKTLEAATRGALKLTFRVLGAPVAAWVRDSEGPELRFLGVRGVGSRRRDQLRGAHPSLRPWESCGPLERAEVVTRVSDVLELTNMAVIDGGDAIILAGGEAPEEASLDVVGSLFQEVLRHLSTVERATRRNAQLDMGIAWTAHEVRGPLLAVKAAIDTITSNGIIADDEVLSRSGDELGDLAGLVDALLRWAVGGVPLRRRPVDLVRVVRQAVDSCRLDVGDERLELTTPESVPIRADAMQLRSAIANVVRNAIAYSPEGSKVTVEVARTDGMAMVSVKDWGPGIPPEERDRIFDPFTRGPKAHVRRNGAGLGLFIAKRVLEAHGGTIWVESSNGTGVVFRMQVPAGH